MSVVGLKTAVMRCARSVLSIELVCVQQTVNMKLSLWMYLDLDAHGTAEEPKGARLQFGEPPPPTPPPPPPLPPDPKPPSPRCSPSPPRQTPQYLPRAPPGQRGRGRGQRRGLGRGQMFEDPAVMRTVEGRPTLKVICFSRGVNSESTRVHPSFVLVA